MMSRAIILAVVGSTWSGVAHAHCEFVPSSQAQQAAEVIKHADHTIQFCEPCGDKAPGIPRQIRNAIAWRVERSVDNVLVDGEDIDQALDLASTFVQISDRRYQNLATIVGCKNTRTQFLKVEDETPNGVMIVADTGEPPPPPPVIAPPVPTPPRTYVTMPPAIIMIPAQSPSIWPGVLAGGGGASAIWAAWALATGRRRRRDMTPRAADLVADRESD